MGCLATSDWQFTRSLWGRCLVLHICRERARGEFVLGLVITEVLPKPIISITNHHINFAIWRAGISVPVKVGAAAARGKHRHLIVCVVRDADFVIENLVSRSVKNHDVGLAKGMAMQEHLLAIQ